MLVALKKAYDDNPVAKARQLEAILFQVPIMQRRAFSDHVRILHWLCQLHREVRHDLLPSLVHFQFAWRPLVRFCGEKHVCAHLRRATGATYRFEHVSSIPWPFGNVGRYFAEAFHSS